MKLYYSPFACSLASHIACREAAVDVELVRVELWSDETESGRELYLLNPMGQVPTLVLDSGRVLTENVAVLSYLSDRARRTTAAPAPDDSYELTRWLSFVATELHKKVLAPVYAPSSPEVVKAHARSSARRALEHLAARLEARDVLLGEDFTVADAYLFWALTLFSHAGVPLEPFPALRRYRKRHRSRPAVDAAVNYERALLGSVGA